MKKIILSSLVLGMILATAGVVVAGVNKSGEGTAKVVCTTIQSGDLVASDESVITIGFDDWGYNYQGKLFDGLYCDSYRDADWCQEYKDIKLSMKWNDAWLSNMDCDGDDSLDRHYGYDSYIGSGAWLTNHQSGEYEGNNGEICNWNYFVKIVAAPSDASSIDGIWYTVDGTEIGPAIWGAFAIIQQVENDKCAGLNGMQYVSPEGAGLGQYKEKVTFIHYADGSHEQIGGPELIKKAKPAKDNSCYSFISKDTEWKIQPDYTISVDGSYGVTELMFIEAVEASINEWNNPTIEDTSFIEFGIQTVDSEHPTGLISDEVNAISFGNYPTENVIAVCSVQGIFRGPPSNREITEFDVMLDTDWAWGDASEDPDVMDLQNILTHELGHAVGLGDLYNSDCSEETMYGWSTEGETKKRDLNEGDIAGLNILYGS